LEQITKIRHKKKRVWKALFFLWEAGDNVTIKINEAEVSIQVDSLSIDDAIGERSVCSFTVIDSENHFEQGQPVEITDGATLLFAGFIDTSSEQKTIGSATALHVVRCADMHYLPDKRIIAKVYENELAGNIVKDLITEKLAAEGITEGTIQDGPTVVEAVFNYVTVSRAMESLAEKADFIWYVDYDKKLYFMARDTVAAPWTATAADMKTDSISLERGNKQYRNTQYVKGGKDITDPITENKIGDGKTRAWVVGFPIAKEPALKLNITDIAAADIGIRGVETGKRYYWSKGSNVISQDDNETLLVSSDTLEVTYRGEFDIIVKTYDQDEIEDRISVEGGSGIVEEVADESNTTTREAAFEIANAKLKKYGVIGQRLRFLTKRSGLFAGQILTVSLPGYGLNSAEMLIESVTITTEQNTVVWYDVSCAEGPEQQNWTKLFGDMAKRGKVLTVRENIGEDEVLVTLKEFDKTWLADTANNIFAELYPAADLYPGAAIYPSFEATDRVKYMELLDGSSDLIIRKTISKQTGTTEILSIVYVSPVEANDTIATVRWYGGCAASETEATGVLVDEQSYSKTKTSLEALQINKTDTKGWS